MRVLYMKDSRRSSCSEGFSWRISLVAPHWVIQGQAQKIYVAIYVTHSVTCAVFDSSKVFPPKDKTNPLKTVLEVSSPGSKCCSHPPFPHRTPSPEKESLKLLSFQTEEISKSFIFLAKQGVDLCCAACDWQGQTEMLLPECQNAKQNHPNQGGFCRFFRTEPNLETMWRTSSEISRLKVRHFVILGKMWRSKGNQKSGSCTVPFEKSLLLLSLKGSSLLLASSRTANLPVSDPEGFSMPVFHSFPSIGRHFQEIPNQATQPCHTHLTC